MQCPKCRVENPDDASFCGECGASQAHEIECPGCGRANPPGQRFCHGCGGSIAAGAAPASDRTPRDYTPKHLADEILQSKSALEGERKQVTVLFADVKGSLELAEQVDSEEWHDILDRFFQILAEGVHRFEGTVNQYAGDGIMALFGAPIAHEDHAQRACYAALHLREALRHYADELRVERGLNFSTRMGINSGEVVVGKIGDDLRMDYTAQGQTVGLAARMQELAEPGKVLLTRHSADLVVGYFELRDLGASRIKGLAELGHLFELEGVGGLRTRLDASRARGFSRFVGRADEMAALEAALARAIDGDGRVVGVVGEAGVGKSRLCYEFAARCRTRGIRLSEARGAAHGKVIPFLPVLEYLRGFFTIEEGDPAQLARNKIAGTLLLLDRELEDALPLLFEFLGVPDPDQPALRIEPEARQRLLLGAVKRMVEARSRREPGVMLLEDLHWLDAGSDEFVAHLVESIRGTRTLLVVNFRPEYRADWMQRSTYQQLPLLPLGPEAIEELLRDLLGAHPSVTDLAERIDERTAGNPFFIEEVVLSLAEEGVLEGERGAYRLARPVSGVAAPASVQAVLAARIDRLPQREKQVLQTAAVVGRSFAEPLLRRVAELAETEMAEALRALVAAEFVYEQALYPEAEYAFKHALTQEVAYGSQLGEPRACIHEGVARAIEERRPDKLDEQAALIASHWDRAGKAREAAEWHRRAGAWVGFSNAPESLRHWSRVRELLAQVPESPETIILALDALSQTLFGSIRVGVSEPEISDLLAEGRGLASRCTDRQGITFFLTSASAVMWNLARLDESCTLAEEARSESDQVAAGVAPMYSRSVQATAYVTTGRLDEALVVTDEVIELAHESIAGAAGGGAPLPTTLFATLGLAWRTWILTLLGRLSEAARSLEQGFERATEGGDLGGTYWCHYAGRVLATTRGDPEAALAHGRQGVEAAEQLGSRTARTGAYVAMGKACVAAARWDEALAALDEALSGPREYGTARWLEPEILSQMAVAHLGLRDGARARALAEQGVALARERLAKPGGCEAELVRARVLLQLEGSEARDEIASALGTAFALAEEMNARSFEPFICEERARLSRVSSDPAAFEEELREAHRLYTEIGATGHAERVAEELAS